MARPTPFTLGAVALTCVLALATLLPARPGKVVTKDGKTWEGDITELPKENMVEVVINGQRHRFSMANLARPPEYDQAAPATPGQRPAPGQPQQPGAAMSPEDEFQKRRSQVADNDVNGLLRLSRWAFERELYDQAYDAAKDARDADPRSREAQDLMRNIDAQRRLNRKVGQQPQQPGARRPVPGGQAPAGQQPGAQQPGGPQQPADGQPAQRPPAQGKEGETDNSLVRPLTPDEVNRIRLLEWRGEPGVRIRMTGEVKRQYLARADIEPARFNKLDAVEQARLIKKDRPELLNDIRMTNDPPAMQEYRTIVQRAVLNSCATAACHGGGAGSDKFALHPRADHEGEAYANFLTLHNYQYKPAKGRSAAMIDRNRPEDSLLIQFGLPPNASNMPHPDVEGFKPMFRTLNDQRYRQFVRWVADSLSPLIDDYGVPFDQDETRGPAQPAAGGQRPEEDAAPGQQPPQDGAAGQAPAGGAGARQAPPPQGGAR